MYPELDLDGDWRITEEAFNCIVELIKNLGCKKIVEFGSGASSIRLAMAFPETKIMSIESDSLFYRETLKLRQKWQKQGNLRVLFSPLGFQMHGPCLFYSYKYQDYLHINGNEAIDCVIIDGPPYFTLRGREACLYQVYNQIPLGGMVILDDFRREGEKNIVENWLSTYPGSFEFQEIDIGHKLALLRKKRHVTPRMFVRAKLFDNLLANRALVCYKSRCFVSALPCKTCLSSMYKFVKRISSCF
jgi:predicted O-methyltransferase YrrM